MASRFTHNLKTVQGNLSKAAKIAGMQRDQLTLDEQLELVREQLNSLSLPTTQIVKVPTTETVVTEKVNIVETVKEVKLEVEEFRKELEDIREAIGSIELVVDNSDIEDKVTRAFDELLVELKRVEREDVNITVDSSNVESQVSRLLDTSHLDQKLQEVVEAIKSIEPAATPAPVEVKQVDETKLLTGVAEIVASGSATVMNRIEALRGDYTMMVVRDKSDKITRIDVTTQIG